MIILILVAIIGVAILSMIIHGWYVADTYTVRDQKEEAVNMNVGTKHVMMVGRIVGGKRVGAEVPMVRSHERSDEVKVEPVAPVVAVPSDPSRDKDPWLYMRMVQQWKNAGRK